MIFDKGVNFIKEHARPLEKQLLEYYFFDGSKYIVLEELIKFHNSDGGFGKNLEPDFRAEHSSVLCTTYALDLLVDLGFNSTEITVISSMKYLMNNYNEETSTWRFLPEIVENYAHAPWWNLGNLDKSFNNHIENPKVKICGYLYHFKDITSGPFRKKILNEVLDYMSTRENKTSIDVITCYTSLYNSKNLPLDAKHTIKKKLNLMIAESVETDPEKWGEYCLKPINVITTSESPFIDVIIKPFYVNLDFEIKNQNVDGSWSPNWNWANTFEDDWHLSKREWSGVLSLERLKLFKEFGKI